MKSLLFNLKSMILVSLLLLSMLARGQGSNSSEQFVDYGDPTMSLVIYYNAIPDRLFIQKRSDVSKDYIISLLNELTNSQFEISWCPKEGYQDDYCRVIVDDIILDSIIDSLLNDDGVLQARRIYVKKGDFDDYLYFIDQSGADFVELLDPILMGTEMWFLNSITCTPKDYNPDLVPISSISNDLNLTFIMVGTSIQFISQKNADIFELQHQLFETGYFIRVSPSFIIPYSDLELDFGDLSGIDVNKSDHFFYYFGDTKKYYYEVPDRIIIEKSDDVTHEYVNTQLNRLINHEFYIRWFAGGTICEVIVDDELASYVIDEMQCRDRKRSALHSRAIRVRSR